LLKETAAIIFRWKWEILAVFAIIVVLTAVSVYVTPPRYESQAMVLIVPGRDKRPFIPDQNTSNIQTYFQLSLEDLTNEIQIIQSYPVLKAVADKVSIDTTMEKGQAASPGLSGMLSSSINGMLVAIGLKRPSPSPEEAAIRNLQQGLNVDFVKRTAVITISFHARSPRRAQEVVNAVVDAFIAQHLKIYSNAGAAQAIRYIGEDFKEQLRAKQDSLQEFKTRKGVIDAGLENQAIERQLTEARSKLLLLERINLDQISTADLANLSDDPAFSQLQTRLTDAELKYLDLSSRYGKDEGKVVSAAKEINEIKKFIGKRIKVSIDSWNQLVVQYQERFEHLEQSSVRITRLEREIQNIKDAIQISAQKSNEMTINAYLDNAAISSLRIIQYGRESLQPVSPKRMKSIFMALIIGAFIGVFYGFIRNRLSPYVFSVSDVETVTRKPVIAALEEFSTKTGVRHAESFNAASRILIPVIDLIGKRKSPSLTLVTSPSPGAGVSFISSVVSRALSSASDSRILSIEILSTSEEMSRCRDRMYLLSPAAEMTPAVLRTRIIAGPHEGLDIMKVGIQSSPVVDQEIISRFIQGLASFDYSRLVLDISAHGADPLYLSFAGHAQSIVLLAAYGITNRYSLARMVKLLERYGHTIDGCVFNRRIHEIPEAVYQWL
jgi:uncharacterized protein involved in exopolysaccharide biosynthesis